MPGGIMLLRKRKNVVVLALIFLCSLFTLSLFQNCSGGIQSQADLSSLSNGSVDTSSTTPPPTPDPVVPPTNPPVLPTGCTTAQPPDEETMTAACPAGKVGTGTFNVFKYTCIGSAWVRNSTPVVVSRCSDPAALPLSNNDILKLCRPFVQNTQVAKVTSTLALLNMTSSLGDGAGNVGNGDTPSENPTATLDPKILAGSQNLSTITIDGQPRDRATYSCKFITQVSCAVLKDGTSTVSKAINMDPSSQNYGMDEVALANAITDPVKKKAALDKILDMVLALGNGNNTANGINSCSFQMTNPLQQTSQKFYLMNNRQTSGYRCVQASLKVRVSAQTQVDVENSNQYKTLPATAPTDFTTLNVTVNNGCWAENNLFISPLPVTANYGAAVAASDRWLVTLSPSDNLLDGAGNILQSQVGSLTIYDKNNLNLAPQKLFLPGIVGGGSTGDSTVAASIYGDSLVVSRVNRKTGKGYVYYFVNSGGWTQRGQVLSQPEGQDKQRFGQALALSSSGLLAVGAPYYAQNESVTLSYGDLSGRVYFYNCNSSTGCGTSPIGEIQNVNPAVQSGLSPMYPGSIFGASLSISGFRVAIGAPYLPTITDYAGEGYVSVYDINPGAFSATLVNRITPPSGTANPAGYGQGFGTSVSINGSKLIVGAPNHATQGTAINEKIGNAYYYPNVSAPQTYVTISGTTAGNLLGSGVALNNKGAFVGCPYCQANMGQVSYHPFDGSGNISATPNRYIFPLDRINRDAFGNAVFATDLDLVVGASNRTVGSNQAAGASYRYAVP